MGVQGVSSADLTGVLPVYRRAGRYAPALSQNARAFAHLLRERTADLWHFVFAPNPRSSAVIRGLRRVRRVPVVQTVASPPRVFDAAEKLIFGDVVVAHSEWTRARLQAQLSDRTVHLIRPPLRELARPTDGQKDQLRAALQIGPTQPVVVYPGDLEFSSGAQLVADTLPLLAIRHPDLVVVFACRRKTTRALAVEARLASTTNSEHVRFAGELPSLLPLLDLADCVLFPVEQLWAKVDIPISVLEAMALGTPVVVPDVGPLAELEAALRVPAEPAELARAVTSLLGDPDKSAHQAAAQRALLESDYDPQTVALRYESLYDELTEHEVAARSARPPGQ
jgi:phosphatidylinositol alpha-1,6-mannosyltransferase